MASARVLVVDDDADLREAVMALLETEGMTATGAADGNEALDALHDGAVPSVILLDLVMPRMDGWRFRVRQALDPRLAGIPVIVMSGHWNAREAASILAAETVVPKPLNVDKLLAAIEDAGSERTRTDSSAAEACEPWRPTSRGH